MITNVTYLPQRQRLIALRHGYPRRIAYGKYWRCVPEVNHRGITTGWVWVTDK